MYATTYSSRLNHFFSRALSRSTPSLSLVLCTACGLRACPKCAQAHFFPSTDKICPAVAGLFCFCAWEQARSRITKYICSSSTPNLLSVRYPASAVFISRNEMKTCLRLSSLHVRCAGILLPKHRIYKKPLTGLFVYAVLGSRLELLTLPSSGECSTN